MNSLFASHTNHAPQQLAAQPAVLIVVGDDDCDLSFIGANYSVHAPDANDLVALSILYFCYQGELAIVIAETDANQTFVRDARLQTERAEITQIHAPVGERLMKFH